MSAQVRQRGCVRPRHGSVRGQHIERHDAAPSVRCRGDQIGGGVGDVDDARQGHAARVIRIGQVCVGIGDHQMVGPREGQFPRPRQSHQLLGFRSGNGGGGDDAGGTGHRQDLCRVRRDGVQVRNTVGDNVAGGDGLPAGQLQMRDRVVHHDGRIADGEAAESSQTERLRHRQGDMRAGRQSLRRRDGPRPSRQIEQMGDGIDDGEGNADIAGEIRQCGQDFGAGSGDDSVGVQDLGDCEVGFQAVQGRQMGGRIGHCQRVSGQGEFDPELGQSQQCCDGNRFVGDERQGGGIRVDRRAEAQQPGRRPFDGGAVPTRREQRVTEQLGLSRRHRGIGGQR